MVTCPNFACEPRGELSVNRARPHPGPLPRGEGEIVPASWPRDGAGLALVQGLIRENLPSEERETGFPSLGNRWGFGTFCSGCFLMFFAAALVAGAAPVISPLGNVTVPAGKSLIIPITATVTNGRAITYTITGSTNAMAIVLHTNNPFWKLNVAQACATNAPGAFPTPFRGGLATVTNVGDMTFMLFPEYAPQTVAIFQGLSAAGFYNSNTIFHRAVTNFVIEGGDPMTNGLGGLVFQYNDEFNPQAIFSGNGQFGAGQFGARTQTGRSFLSPWANSVHWI